MQEFIKNLEQKNQLTQTEKKEIPDFMFSPRSRNIKQNLENLFRHLNQIKEITSKEIYSEALEFFNVEIRKSGRGHIVVVTDDFGNPIRYPIRLSNFKEGPKFMQQEIAKNQSLNTNFQTDKPNICALSQIVKSAFIQGLNPKEKQQKDKKQMIKRRKGRKI